MIHISVSCREHLAHGEIMEMFRARNANIPPTLPHMDKDMDSKSRGFTLASTQIVKSFLLTYFGASSQTFSV
jgi:hypothetical protein